MERVDIGLYGATGFTGQLAAAWLAGRGASFSIAGRDRGKLEQVRESLGRDVPIVVCDSGSEGSLRAFAEGCNVVLTTVGPYAKHGLPVVQAAVDAGCDYVDITGEPAFVDASRLRFHAGAAEKGLRIVHCCGFDSLPHDLGAWYTVKQLPADAELTVNAYVSTRGGISGGTWASALDAMADRPKKERTARDANAHPVRVQQRFHRSALAGGWAVPMPTIDPVIVARSARALRYGSSFTYGHFARVKTTRYLVGGALAIGAVAVGAQIGPLRTWMKARWPSGSGPSEEVRENGWFKVRFIGSGGGREVVVDVTGDKDPGYALTSRWVAESAMCLASDRAALPERFGVLTTAEAMAEPLFARMAGTGTKFEVVPAGS